MGRMSGLRLREGKLNGSGCVCMMREGCYGVFLGCGCSVLKLCAAYTGVLGFLCSLDI